MTNVTKTNLRKLTVNTRCVPERLVDVLHRLESNLDSDGDKNIVNVMREDVLDGGFGLTENDGHENDGPSKLQGMKLQAMKMTDQVAGHENARHENTGHENEGHENAGHENAGHENAGHENTAHENARHHELFV